MSDNEEELSDSGDNDPVLQRILLMTERMAYEDANNLPPPPERDDDDDDDVDPEDDDSPEYEGDIIEAPVSDDPMDESSSQHDDEDGDKPDMEVDVSALNSIDDIKQLVKPYEEDPDHVCLLCASPFDMRTHVPMRIETFYGHTPILDSRTGAFLRNSPDPSKETPGCGHRLCKKCVDGLAKARRARGSEMTQCSLCRKYVKRYSPDLELLKKLAVMNNGHYLSFIQQINDANDAKEPLEMKLHAISEERAPETERLEYLRIRVNSLEKFERMYEQARQSEAAAVGKLKKKEEEANKFAADSARLSKAVTDLSLINKVLFDEMYDNRLLMVDAGILDPLHSRMVVADGRGREDDVITIVSDAGPPHKRTAEVTDIRRKSQLTAQDQLRFKAMIELQKRQGALRTQLPTQMELNAMFTKSFSADGSTSGNGNNNNGDGIVMVRVGSWLYRYLTTLTDTAGNVFDSSVQETTSAALNVDMERMYRPISQSMLNKGLEGYKRLKEARNKKQKIADLRNAAEHGVVGGLKQVRDMSTTCIYCLKTMNRVPRGQERDAYKWCEDCKNLRGTNTGQKDDLYGEAWGGHRMLNYFEWGVNVCKGISEGKPPAFKTEVFLQLFKAFCPVERAEDPVVKRAIETTVSIFKNPSAMQRLPMIAKNFSKAIPEADFKKGCYAMLDKFINGFAALGQNADEEDDGSLKSMDVTGDEVVPSNLPAYSNEMPEPVVSEAPSSSNSNAPQQQQQQTMDPTIVTRGQPQNIQEVMVNQQAWLRAGGINTPGRQTLEAFARMFMGPMPEPADLVTAEGVVRARLPTVEVAEVPPVTYDNLDLAQQMALDALLQGDGPEANLVREGSMTRDEVARRIFNRFHLPVGESVEVSAAELAEFRTRVEAERERRRNVVRAISQNAPPYEPRVRPSSSTPDNSGSNL